MLPMGERSGRRKLLRDSEVVESIGSICRYAPYPRIISEPCQIEMDCKVRNTKFKDRPLQAHCKPLRGSTAGIRSGHFEGPDFRCHFDPAPHRHGYVLSRWGLIQLVQNDSLRRCKVLSASLVSGPRDENPAWLVRQIIENTGSGAV